MQQFDKLLSIIIPTYNQEDKIKKCLDSLLNQDIKNYEIIVINDGSTDKTADIINEYVQKHNIISTINQENQGQGIARNTGIAKAKGKYIMFVDSDDYIEQNSISILLQQMVAKDLDLLCGNYNKVDTNGNILKKTNVENVINYTTDIVTHDNFLLNHFGFYCYVCLFVFKKDLLNNLNFSFKPHIYLEDTEWLSKVICYAKRISMIDFCFYNYVQTPNSSMRAPEKLEKILHDTLYVTKCLKSFKDENVRNYGTSMWFKEIISFNSIMICSTVAKKGFEKCQASSYKTLKDINVFPLKIKRMPFKFKIIAYIINFNWNIAVLLISTINRLKRC